MNCKALVAALIVGLVPAAQARAQDDDDRPKKHKKLKDEEADESDKEKEREREKEKEREEADREREKEERRHEREKAERDAEEAPKKEKAHEKAAGKDHDLWVGHVGASWFGTSEVPIADGAPTGTKDNPGIAPPGPKQFVTVPAIGIRYWMSRVIGLDIGIGFSASTGSIRSTSTAIDKKTVFGFLIHAGVPLSPVQGKHIALLITPEINFGFANSRVEPALQTDPPPSAELWGTRFDIGAKIGGEIYFGFMGIPELALEGSIGAYLTHQRTTISVAQASYAETDVLATTIDYKDPWRLFTSLVAARYYF